MDTVNGKQISIDPLLTPPLDGQFEPSVLWNRSFRQSVAESGGARPLALGVMHGERVLGLFETQLGPDTLEWRAANDHYAERLVKCLLYSKGGHRVVVGGDNGFAERLQARYQAGGTRAFDADLLGKQIYRSSFDVTSCPVEEMPSDVGSGDSKLGGHLDGCRIGFDLGGSDRKAAAVIDGKVVFSEEITWDPYFQADPQYHFDGICDSLKRAAAHLPRVDAVGGSAAGVYVNNEVRAASLFRGIPEARFDGAVRRIFFDVMSALGWEDVPWEVINDGEVTALAGAMAIDDHSLLGLSMGTSFAAGYVTPTGSLSSGLNELAFVPVDHRLDGPKDEWSGDVGCGVQFFSQQGIARLARGAGVDLPEAMPLPERLIQVQELMEQGDSRAEAIYRTIGINFGYTIAHFAELYELRHLLILGRVTSGAGGERILEQARAVLDREFESLSRQIAFHIPDEKQKRHGQAIAAASLAALKESA